MTGNKALAGQNNGGREAQKRLAGIRKELAALAEPDYAAFAAKLLRKPQEAVPGGSAARLLGVRLPALRKMAARLAKEDWAGNLEALEGAGDGAAFEEIMLRGFLIGQAKIAPGKAFALIRGFLPCVDNWSLCDSFCAGLKFAEKNREALWDFLQPCFASSQEYEVRFAVVTALDYFVTEEYLEREHGVGVIHYSAWENDFWDNAFIPLLYAVWNHPQFKWDMRGEEGKKYGVTIPWFIMTSRENNKATIEFFEKHKFFGYQNNKNIFFFVQGELPMIDTEGKILIGEDGLIKQAADGHGGIYESLVKNGMTKIMKHMGIEWVFIGGVDNCLVKMVDPVLMGVAIDKNVTVACKSVVKANPHEKVGVFCKRNGKPNVIEYSEITEDMAEATDENGELLYGESHILCNLFSVDAIERMGANPLPYHVAYKKATYMDKDGNIVVPDSPNAYKFEAFLFDAFGNVDDMAVLRVKREEEFAPVKNADSAGVDCPRTARELYKKYYHLD